MLDLSLAMLLPLLLLLLHLMFSLVTAAAVFAIPIFPDPGVTAPATDVAALASYDAPICVVPGNGVTVYIAAVTVFALVADLAAAATQILHCGCSYLRCCCCTIMCYCKIL